MGLLAAVAALQPHGGAIAAIAPLSRPDAPIANRFAHPAGRPVLVAEAAVETPRRLPLPNPRRVLRDGLVKAAEKKKAVEDGRLGVNKQPPGAIVPVPPNLCGDLEKAGLVAELIAPIVGEGGCAIRQPIRYSRVGKRYSVGLSTAVISTCSLARQFVAWLDEAVQQIALKVYDQPVVRVSVAASYVCRPVNGDKDRKQSQHGLGNAIDVSEFVFADGSSVSVLFGWADKGKGQKFLRAIHSQACRYFSTVIGPDGDRWHTDHIHLDLGKHGSDGTSRVCQ